MHVDLSEEGGENLRAGKKIEDSAARLRKRLRGKLGENFRMPDEQFYSESAWRLKRKVLKAAYLAHKEHREAQKT